MKILFTVHDQDFSTTKSLGILNFSFGMLHGLAHHGAVSSLDILANSSLHERLSPLRNISKVNIHRADTPPPKKFSRLLWDNYTLSANCDALQPDWIFFPKGFAPLVKWPKAKVCAHVHDLMFSWYARTNSSISAMERHYFPKVLRRTLRRADLITVSSDFIKSELGDRHGHIEKIGIGFSSTTPLPFTPSEHGILVLLSPFPHKLSAQAIPWLLRWQKETDYPHPIHCVGTPPVDVAFPSESNWYHHTRLPQGEYESLLRKCNTLVYFSAYEGFGMPPFEAFLAGTNAIASSIPTIRENFDSSVLFDNDDYDDFKAKLDESLARPMPCPAHLQSWQETADKLLTALESLETKGQYK